MVAIPFSYNLANARVSPVANDAGLTVLESDGLHLDSGLAYYTALGATTFYDFNTIGIINHLEPTAPTTMTMAQYGNLQLIAGEKLVIDYDYIPYDYRYNDFAFSLLKDSRGNVTPILLSDEQNYLSNNSYPSHFVATYTIGESGSYDLVLASADAGDALEASTLIVHSISVQVPTADYTLTGGGVLLGDGSLITPGGALISPNGATDPNALSAGASDLVTKLDNLFGAGLISQDGNGLISQDGNGVISNDGGSLIGDDGSSLVSPDGSLVISNDGGSLIGQDGNGLIPQNGSGLISSTGAGLISQNGDRLISQDGNGLISQDGNGLISQDGNGLISQDGNGLTGNTYATLSLDESGGLTRQFSATGPTPPGNVPLPGTSSSSTATTTTQTGPAAPGAPILASAPTNLTYLQQLTPSVVALPNGQFVVAWTSYDPNSGFGSSVLEQLLNADGTASGATFNASGQAKAFSENQSVAALAGGGFVIAWTHSSTVTTNAGDVTTSSVAGARFSAAGAYLAAAAIPVSPTGNQDQVSLLGMANGGFLELWRNSGASASNNTIRGQLWAADGSPTGKSFPVSAHLATTNAATPASALLNNGGGVVVYSDTGVDPATGAAPGIVAVILASNGAITRASVAPGPHATEKPAVAALANGRFVVAWIDDAGGASASVKAQIFTSAGVATDSAFVVTTATIPHVDPPAIAVLGDGRFVISWTVAVVTGGNTNQQVLAQAYNQDGLISGAQFSGSPSGYVSESAMATLSTGTLEIASSDRAHASSEIHVEPVSFSASATTTTTTTTPGASPGIAGAEILAGPAAAAPVFDKAPSAAALSNGVFAVAWNVVQGNAQSIQVQLESAAGIASGSLVTIAPITTRPLDDSLSPTVVALPAGQFAVVYMESSSFATNSGFSTPVNVYAQLFGADATKLGGPTLLRATDGLHVSGLAAAALSDGSFITLTTDYNYNTQVTTLAAQRTTSSGAAIGSSIPVATQLGNISSENLDAITGLPNNGFAVAVAGLGIGLYVQVFDNFNFAPSPVKIPTQSTFVTQPRLATLANGNFVVAWNQNSGLHNSANTAFGAQVVSKAGALVGGAIAGPVGAFNSDPPAITALADGRFIVAYDVQAGSGNATTGLVRAQIYNADGTISGGAIDGNAANAAAFVSSPAIAQLANGTIEIVSEHAGGPAGGSDIRVEAVSLASAPALVGATQQGRAVDGYISGATVFADANNDGVFEAGEATATTDALGRYNFTTPASGTVILTGGADVSTGLAFQGTLEAPAGSLTVSPLSTLVQKLVAGGATLPNAQLAISAAFGLAANTDYTTLDPVRSTLESLAGGPRSLVASTTIQEVVVLATAAGATGDLYAKLAALIAAGSGSFDPTTPAVMQALGLAGDVATATSALAAASYQLALGQITVDAANPQALLFDVADIEKLEQGTVAPALAAGIQAGDLGPVVAAYTGPKLAKASGVAVACFLSGTRIALSHGEAAVETLRAGDMALTAEGEPRAIEWLGHRRIDCRKHPRPHDVWPVRIAPGAFGPGLPLRDLWLSPDHAVFIDGALIPVRYLVNGATIVREEWDAVTYWHVELGRHDVILAEGLPCESYLDTGNRGAFANGGGAIQMHADFARRVWDTASYAPLVLDGAGLEAARSHLLERATALGHATTRDPELRLVAGGREIWAEVADGRHRFTLPPGTAGVRLVSRAAVPAQVHDDSDDHRLLGVAISGLWLDGQPLSLTDARLGSGWHGHEGDWRWMDGDAGIALAHGGVLAVRVAMAERYWLAPLAESPRRQLG